MKNHEFYFYMNINTHISKFIMLYIITLLMAVMCSSNVLCDVVNKGHELIDTFFGEFLALFKEIQKNKEG